MLAYKEPKSERKASPIPKAGFIDSSSSGVCAFDVGAEHTAASSGHETDAIRINNFFIYF